MISYQVPQPRFTWKKRNSKTFFCCEKVMLCAKYNFSSIPKAAANHFVKRTPIMHEKLAAAQEREHAEEEAFEKSFLETTTAPDFDMSLDDDEQLSALQVWSLNASEQDEWAPETGVSATTSHAARIADENRKLRHIGAQLFGPAERVAEYLAAQALYDNLLCSSPDPPRSAYSSISHPYTSDPECAGLSQPELAAPTSSLKLNYHRSNEELATSDQSSSLDLEKRLSEGSLVPYGAPSKQEPPQHLLVVPRLPPPAFSADELSDLFSTSGWTTTSEQEDHAGDSSPLSRRSGEIAEGGAVSSVEAGTIL